MLTDFAWFEPVPEYFVLELPGMELHVVTTAHGIACAWWTFLDEDLACTLVERG